MSSLAPELMVSPGLAAHIANYHLAHADRTAARAVLASGLAAQPDAEQERRVLARAWCALGHASIAAGDVEGATEAIGQAQMLSDEPDVWRLAAQVASLRDDAPNEHLLLQRVTAAEGSTGADWLALARACEKLGSAEEAADCYLAAAQRDPSHATILTVAARVASLMPAAGTGAGAVRIAILGSSTLDHLRAYLEVQCRLSGLVPAFYVCPFGQYAQDILAPESALHAFAPEIIILAVHGRALFAPLYTDLVDLDINERRAACEQAAEDMVQLIAQLTARSAATVLLHTFATPQHSPLGIQELRDPFGQSVCFRTINESIAQRMRQDFPSVHLIDEDRVLGRIGKRHVTDSRMWFLARMGYAPAALQALATEYVRYVKALKGCTRKCLVLDLDNTLWGGVVGEDGTQGIKLGQDGPGSAYRAFQEAIVQLWKRGVILAIASKNNEKDALEVLERHPEMLLRPRHFATMRINWQDKATNLASIATELNIGLDSMVFLDDNPAECALVRASLPEVLTVQLPRDPAAYRRLLLEMTDFDSLTLTEEDRQRGALYAQRRQRQEWQARNATDLEGYLAGLGVVVQVAQADELVLPRVVQLIGKTNQFNLTSRRHNEATIRHFAASAEYLVLSVRVHDRFGDHGLVGVAIVARQDMVWEIDTLLLSCRVLGCGVETAVLSVLVQAARHEGIACLRGLVVTTAKNVPAQDFYGRHAFSRCGEVDGTTVWELDPRARTVETPNWVTLEKTD